MGAGGGYDMTDDLLRERDPGAQICSCWINLEGWELISTRHNPDYRKNP